MPRPQATDPTNMIWKAQSKFSQPAPSTSRNAAAEIPTKSPVRRRMISNSKMTLAAWRASSTAMYGT